MNFRTPEGQEIQIFEKLPHPRFTISPVAIYDIAVLQVEILSGNYRFYFCHFFIFGGLRFFFAQVGITFLYNEFF